MVRGEVVMAGIGGMGVLVAGQILSHAAFQRHKHASYVPSYGFARRGGNSEYTVIFSDEKISSPILDQAQVVVLLDSSQFGVYESRVRPGGVFIVEKSGLTADRERQNYKLYMLPTMEIAVSMGASVLVGLIMLGACVAIIGSISQQLIEAELRIRYGDNEKSLARNIEAFRHGLELGKSAK
jgi:2-oxoglutarate ferredoxin oxidoreductase subunit gamma